MALQCPGRMPSVQDSQDMLCLVEGIGSGKAIIVKVTWKYFLVTRGIMTINQDFLEIMMMFCWKLGVMSSVVTSVWPCLSVSLCTFSFYFGLS